MHVSSFGNVIAEMAWEVVQCPPESPSSREGLQDQRDGISTGDGWSAYIVVDVAGVVRRGATDLAQDFMAEHAAMSFDAWITVVDETVELRGFGDDDVTCAALWSSWLGAARRSGQPGTA